MDSTGSEKASAHYIPLPVELYSSESGKPIANCMMCEKYLLDDHTHYMIEKAYRQIPEMNVKEVIFEYAMCFECAIKMHESLSVESRQRIQEYFERKTDLEKRSANLTQGEAPSFREWTENCIVTNKPVSESKEFQVIAQCQGKHMLFTHLPFVLSGSAIEEMSELLSAKSRGELDDFIGKYFTGPPEVSEILKKKLIVI